MNIRVNSNIADLLNQIAHRRDAAINRASMKASVFTVVPYARHIEYFGYPGRGAMFRKGAAATEWFFAQEAAKVDFMNPQSLVDCLNRVAVMLQANIQKFTPVRTGNLKGSLTVRLAKI